MHMDIIEGHARETLNPGFQSIREACLIGLARLCLTPLHNKMTGCAIANHALKLNQLSGCQRSGTRLKLAQNRRFCRDVGKLIRGIALKIAFRVFLSLFGV